MKIRLVPLLMLSLLILFSESPSSRAEWEFESENKPNGISAYATTFWVEGIGPISLDDLTQLEDEIEEGTYWSTLMVSCVRKKLIVGMNVNMAGSGNREIALDDPGYAYLRFDSVTARKYKTFGSDLPSSITFSTDAKSIVTNFLKSKTVTITVRDRIARERITMKFDVSYLAKAKVRFRYAGCKL